MAQDAIINRWDINGDVYDIQDAGRGRPLGVATLDENGRVPYTQLPESAIEFKGYWDASTNTPTLHDGTGTKGDLYYVDVAGSQDLGSGTQFFNVGDRVLYDGSVWKNMSSDVTDEVTDGDMRPVTSNAVYDALKNKDEIPVGLVSAYYGTTDPEGGKWLICDGRDTTGTAIELETHYPNLFMFLGGTNVLPDLRECVPVGVGQNGTDTIATHDVYTLGQFKDDQMQKITATANMQGSVSNGTATGAMAVTSRGYHGSGSSQATNYINNINFDSSRQTRTGTPNVTHGKQKGVNWIIKATSSADTAPIPSTAIQQIEQYFDEGLSRAESYSTTETWTGGYWIDGKKIYRKVFDGLSFGGTTGSWTNTGATLSNVDSLVKGIALRKNSSQNSIINAMNFQMSGTNIQYYLTTSTFGSSSRIVIEYTKTTD